MIDTAIQELQQTSLSVIFVIKPNRTDVHDAFIRQLNVPRSIANRPEILSFQKQSRSTFHFAFVEKMFVNLVAVTITLTGPDQNSLKETQKKIEQLAQSCSDEKHLTDETDLIDWSQDTIRSYYLLCLERNVLPTMKIGQGTLDLLGPKEAVGERFKVKDKCV